MKAKRVICIIKGHIWVVGRVADRPMRELAPGRKSYHNRACCRCGKEEWHADEAEAEGERVRIVRELLHQTRKVARLKKIDPKRRPVNPNEFP